MNISLIDKTLKPIASLNNCNSMIWTTKLWDHSTVALQLDPSLSTELVGAWGIVRDDADEIMRITSIKRPGDSIEIDGTAFTQAFERRAVLAVQSFSAVDASLIARTLINNSMNPSDKMPGITRSFSFMDSMPPQQPSGKLVTYNSDYGVVFDEVKNVIDDAPLRFYVNGRVPSLYVGRDVSQSVVFSEEAGDISSYEFTKNYLEYANMAVVCGSGEGAARIVALVDKRVAGDELFELYVDDTSEATTNLISKGSEELSKLPVVLALEATVSSNRNVFRRDYQIGDSVGYKTSQASGTDIVSEVEETIENGSVQIKLSLGQTAPTIKEYIDSKTR